MAYNFFPMISRMRYINRWGLMRNTRLENIQEHSQRLRRQRVQQVLKRNRTGCQGAAVMPSPGSFYDRQSRSKRGAELWQNGRPRTRS